MSTKNEAAIYFQVLKAWDEIRVATNLTTGLIQESQNGGGTVIDEDLNKIALRLSVQLAELSGALIRQSRKTYDALSPEAQQEVDAIRKASF